MVRGHQPARVGDPGRGVGGVVVDHVPAEGGELHVADALGG